jgi:hypothetical protein
MRSIHKLSVLLLAAGALSACEVDKTVTTENIPTAGVRFINAVPDTGNMDMRFVDQVESNAHWSMPFRGNIVTTSGVPASTLIQFKGARAGSRQFRIFMNSATNQALASTVVKDTTVTLVAGVNYTALMMGNARGGAPAMRLTWIEESVADPGANVALRVINATGATINVRHYLSTGAAPATAQFANLAAMGVSAYVQVPPTTLNATTTTRIMLNVRDNTDVTALVATDAAALVGFPACAATCPAPEQTVVGPRDALPGTAVAGSALTAIVFPRSVAGSAAANFTTPAVTFVWDRRPPRPAGI